MRSYFYLAESWMWELNLLLPLCTLLVLFRNFNFLRGYYIMCCFQIKQHNFSKLPLYFELKYANKKGMSTFQKRWMVVSKDINIVSTDLSKWIIFCDIPRWSKGSTLWDRGSINKLAFGIFNNLHASFSQVKTKLKGHQKRITGLAFSHNLNVLVSSGADSQVKKNRVFCNHNQPVAEMLSRAQPPSCLAYTCPFLSFTIHIKIISLWPQGQALTGDVL